MADPRPDRPLDELLEVTTPEQFKALGHPFRQRLLFALGQRPATISQLAGALGSAKGNVAHHLKVLREAGMVRVAHTRPVRGGTEQYYQRSARRIRVAPGHVGATAAMLGAVAEEIAAAPDEPLLQLRHLRLTRAQAERLGAALSELVDGAEDAGDDEPRYGVLVSLYRQATPPPSGPPDTPTVGQNRA
ncbi:ArsR/SmtB family transcription factor [Micromonospora globbae]|jgi:DNA-binding transcriptional ArsR family regulator|uniref:ArsR family transcriptional regulator n=1 Tax=Micromonospora globbae TaxID=1894969 RepID=A0A420EY23_9ACTN|nr:winged helix-turn-helix domain-containing protein [Micromonospora globbae]RKF25666.1 ArsR family transcriptional regulator [Micromonospora globbae]